jgi:hypothetical protein
VKVRGDPQQKHVELGVDILQLQQGWWWLAETGSATSGPETRHTHQVCDHMWGRRGGNASGIGRAKGIVGDDPRSLEITWLGNDNVSKDQNSTPREGPHLFPLLFDDLSTPPWGARVTPRRYWEQPHRRASRDAGTTAWRGTSSHLSGDHDADDAHL